MEGARPLDFFEFVALSVEGMAKAVFTQPDDDWVPMLFFLGTKDGEEFMSMAPLDHFMTDDKSKDMLAYGVLPRLLKEFQVKVAVLLINGWTASDPPGGYLNHGVGEWIRPSQRPDRKEMLLLSEYTREGVMRQASALIVRHESAPPTLEPWKDIDAKSMSGRFVEPIVKAMREMG